MEVKRWIVVEDEFEVGVGARDDAIEGVEGGTGLIGGLQVPGGIIEKAAVEDGGDVGIFLIVGVTQIDGAAVGERESRAAGGTGEQCPALGVQIAGVGAEVGGFVEIVDADALFGVMHGCDTDMKKVADKRGQRTIGANFSREGGVFDG